MFNANKISWALIKKVVLSLLLVVALLFTAACNKGDKKSSHDKRKEAKIEETAPIVAEQYFLNYVEKDWEKVYDYLYIPDSEFTTKELFLSMIERNPEKSKVNEVIDYTVAEVNEEESSYRKKYKIEYMESNALNSQTMEIVLIKNSDSKNGWKISAEEFIVKDYSVIVPLESKITIDGLPVDSKYKTSTTYEDKYLINYIFNGGHEIYIESNYLESVSGTFKASINGECRFSNFNILDSSLQEMYSILTDMSNSIFKAAINGDSFETIRHLYAPDCDEDKIRTMYANLCKDVSEHKVYSVDFSDIVLRSDYTQEYRNDDFTFVGFISTNETYYSISNGMKKVTKPIFQLPQTIEAIFRYIDGRWQVEVLYVGLGNTRTSLQ